MMNDNILVKFKISNHKLLIEQGRYQIDHLSREHRSGRRWDSFLLPKKNNNTVQRQAFINQINRITPDFDKKSSPESMKLIKNSKNHNVNELVIEFISSCMKIHDSMLVMQLFFLVHYWCCLFYILIVIGMLLQYCTMMRSCKTITILHLP